MKTIKKNVYYCDYCNKRGLSAAHMKKHEKGCTLNPDRQCSMVCEAPESIRSIIFRLKQRFVLKKTSEQEMYDTDRALKVEWIGEPVTLKEIREATDNCPACMMAVIRQLRFNYHYFDGMVEGFDFKAEMKERYNSMFTSEYDY